VVEVAVSQARDEVLARVRSAIAGSTAGAAERRYRHDLGLASTARTDLFCERVADYRATVRRIRGDGIAAAVAEAATGGVVVPDGVPAEWLPPDLRVVRDAGLSPTELDAVDGVLTGCTLGIAETGTIVLSGAPGEGRRALTLVPDLHVCVVRASQVVDSVPGAIAALGPLVRDERRPLTFVSGPSATSDIELDRVEGVHGPRTLVVLVVEDA
jgi:L-lactate dehydrogenase complex protein LldG